MKIETKYNLEDTVWVMHENKVESGMVAGLDATISPMNSALSITYIIHYLPKTGARKCAEYELYPSKEELLKSL